MPLFICPVAAPNCFMIAALVLALMASIFSCESTTWMSSLTIPVALTLATPSTPSSLAMRFSCTKADVSASFMSSTLTAATVTGIMSGLIFMMIGSPTISSQEPDTRSIFSRMSTDSESMFTSSENSMTIME